MAYQDYSSHFNYKGLLTYQELNQLGANDEYFKSGSVSVSGDWTFGGNVTVNGNLNLATIDAKARAYASGTQSVDGTAVVNLDLENFDLGSDFDTSTHRFTAPRSGYYQISACIHYSAVQTGASVTAHIQKNGSTPVLSSAQSNAEVPMTLTIADILYLNAGDYIELMAETSGGTATVYGVSGANYVGAYTHLAVSQLL